MMKTCAAFTLCGLTATPLSATTIYVAPTGNDTNPGTLQKPLASLAAAQRAVRAAKDFRRAPITVLLRGGTYYLPETFVLTAADSGTKTAPVGYDAYPHEVPIISGGSKLSLQWRPYKDGIMQAAVPGGFTSDQLFVNGARQPMARYPNFDAKAQYFNGFAADAFSKERAARWADPAGGYIHAMHTALWGDYHYRITGKDAAGNVTYEGGWQNNRQMGMHDQYRFVENIFEELDAPGEWFLNTKTHTLYFYPPAGLDLGRATVEAVRLRHLVEFHGDATAPVRYVTLQGLTFRHAARTFMDNREPLLRSDWTTYRGGAVFFNGSEDCALTDCELDQLGGNAVFVNNYNRRVTVRGCHIVGAGANGVAFIGDPKAVRSPLFEYNQRQSFHDIDKTPGPQTSNYPADCLVEDCLIHATGRVEKQTAPIEIDMAQRITVRHCSIYDVPRAGINIGDGAWGGHLIEDCDVFDTVKETGDHGSFNSWGRDRYWGLKDIDLNTITRGADKNLPLLDMTQPNILRHNRWRCDHGWDIDLDDGSANYQIRDNLCLNGGIKNREGFYRVVENNIMVNNSFHPHVWYNGSEDVFRHNIVFQAYKPIGVAPPWGREVDANLWHQPGVKAAQPATPLQQQSGRDAHSLMADALFIDPSHGDYRVQSTSPALTLGFKNFLMDDFGVRKPSLKAIALTPELPQFTAGTTTPLAAIAAREWRAWLGARVKTVNSLGEVSAAGLAAQSGVLLLDVPAGSLAASAGLRKLDVILAANGHPVKTFDDLLAIQNAAVTEALQLKISRDQQPLALTVTGFIVTSTESRADAAFQTVRLAPQTALIPAVLTASPLTQNDPLATLTDGVLQPSYGPVFGNGITDGKYKLDLGTTRSIAAINTWSFNMNGRRGPQKFTLFGSAAPTDPGWDVADATKFAPIAEVDTTSVASQQYVATSVRRNDGKELGLYRWLVWGVAPVTTDAGGENTAFQEFQVVPALGRE